MMPLKNIFFLFALALLPIITIIYLCTTMGIESQTMTRDVAAIARLHPIAGFLSSFGMIMWCIAATVLFFTNHLLKDKFKNENDTFFKHFGMLTAYLGLDDFFQLHEVVGPQYLHIPEKVMMLSIVILAILVFLKNQKSIFGRYFLIFLASITFLAGSVIFDSLWFKPPFGHWNFLIEDSMKWFGICLWTIYATLKTSEVVQKNYLTN